MAKIGALLGMNSASATTKYYPMDFKQYRGTGQGLLIRSIYFALEGVGGLTITPQSVFSVAIGRGASTGGANKYPGVDLNTIWKERIWLGGGAEITRFITLPEPALVDEGSCFMSGNFENLTGTVSADFVLYGDLVKPTELEAAILAFQTD